MLPPSTETNRRRPPDARRHEPLAAVDWDRVTTELDNAGVARLGRVLDPEACAALSRRYEDDRLFRSRIIMARHGFGRGEYKYFANPLPAEVDTLRRALYPRLAGVANAWAERLGLAVRYPADLADFLAHCHADGQTKPTPLLLRYGPGDYNCLHQDIYGPHTFPIQVVVLLSAPGRDFTGGEFVVVEQRPRMQSRAEVVIPVEGEAVAFAVRERPVRGTKGDYRVNLRHGVSRIHTGERTTLGIIFHDAA